MTRVLLGVWRWPLAVLAASTIAGSTIVGLLESPDRYMVGDTVTLRYRDIGRGEPVILLHGYTDQLEMWSAMADSLAATHRVIVPDVRGFGKSSKFATAQEYGQRTVDDILRLMDHLAIESAHVVGYSMGAAMTANLAVRAPARVRSAGLIAGPFWPDSASFDQWIAPHLAELRRGNGLVSFFREIMPTWPDSVIAPMAQQLLAANDGAALVASMTAMPALMLDSGRVARLQIPALAIVGGDDRTLVPGTERIARWWPGARKVVLTRGDHADIAFLPEVIAEVRGVVAMADDRRRNR